MFIQTHGFRNHQPVASVPAKRAKRSCYARDVNRLRAHTPKPLNQISLGDLLSFAESLIAAGRAPVLAREFKYRKLQ